MNLLQSPLCICLAICTAEACRGGNCEAFCAGEEKDESKMLTFYSKDALESFNNNFENENEKFKFLYRGKCNYKKPCHNYKKVEICAIVESGCQGAPRTFNNFCELNKYNCENPKNEYVYYHDDCCNVPADANPSPKECKCLDCTNEPVAQVCALSSEPNDGHLKTFDNYCSLKKSNCEHGNEYLYWHEGCCYTDEVGASAEAEESEEPESVESESEPEESDHEEDHDSEDGYE